MPVRIAIASDISRVLQGPILIEMMLVVIGLFLNFEENHFEV